MENKDLIIIGLIALVIYLAYQQNQQQPLPIQPNNTEVQELKQQVNHYQTLYQKRVAKDLAGEEVVKVHQQKISDLEKQLLELAKIKVKGKKEFQKLVKKLEENWQNKEADYLVRIEDQSKLEEQIKNLSESNDNLIKAQEEWTQTQKKWNTSLQSWLSKFYSLYGEVPEGSLGMSEFYDLLKAEREREREREREQIGRNKADLRTAEKEKEVNCSLGDFYDWIMKDIGRSETFGKMSWNLYNGKANWVERFEKDNSYRTDRLELLEQWKKSYD